MQYEDFIKYAKKWGLSYADLAEKIGIALNSFYNYKKGKPLRNKTKYKLKAFYDKYIAEPAPTITRKQTTPTITRTQTTPTITRTLKTEKVNLTDETEIIDALNNGETIIGNNGSKYRKVNGFVVRYGISDTALFIGAAIDLVNDYYVIREVPFKLKVGNKYKRVDGVIGNVFASTPTGTYYVIFLNDTKSYVYKEDGTCITEGLGEEFNLIEEC